MWRKWSQWMMVGVLLSIAGLLFVSCEEKTTTPTVPTTAHVSGQVMSQENGMYQWIAGARVELGDRFTTTDERGEYTFASVPFGQYQLRVRKDGFADYYWNINVDEVTLRHNVFMTRRPTQYRDVSGQVFFTSNQVNYPIEGAHVTVADKSDETDAQGQFMVVGVPFGQQQMRVEKAGYHPTEQPLDVSETTPSQVAIQLNVVTEPNDFVNETLDYDVTRALNGLNFNANPVSVPVVTTAENVSNSIFANIARGAGSYEQVVRFGTELKLTPELNPDVWKVGGSVKIRGTTIVSAAALLAYMIEKNVVQSPEEELQYTELTLDTGREHITFLAANSNPLFATGRTMYNWELYESNYSSLTTVNTIDEFVGALRMVGEQAVANKCSIYTFGMAAIGEQRSRVVGALCAIEGAYNFVNVIVDFVNDTYGGPQGLGIFIQRRPTGNQPFCFIVKAHPAPPPFYDLIIAPEQVTTKVGQSPIQFEATAIDANNQQHNVNEISTWSLEGLSGTLVDGYFTPWQAGTGYVVVSLRPQWDLDARATVTVKPMNRPPDCEFTTIIRTTADELAYWVSGRVTDPDDDSFNEITVDFADGSVGHVGNHELNALGEFTVTHHFPDYGDYSLHLRVIDEDGADCTSNYPLHISRPVNHPPTVTPITSTTITKNSGEVFTVIWQGADPDASDTIQKYRIRDSVNQTWQDHFSTSAQLRYNNACSCWFEVKAVDNHGLEGAAVRWDITVIQPNLPPTACFGIEPSSGDTQTIFTFNPSCSSDDRDLMNELWMRWKVNNSPWTGWQQEYLFSTTLPEGTNTIYLEAKDSGDLVSLVSHSVVVSQSNNPPVVSPVTASPISVDIDQEFTVSWTGNDPDPGDSVAKYEQRDSEDQTWRDCYSIWVRLSYHTAGQKWFEVRAVDNHGLAGAEVRWVINVAQPNRPPEASLACPGTGTVNTPITITIGYSDPDSDPMQYGAIDWNDGSGIQYIYAIAPVDHTFAVDGTYTIRWTVLDDRNNWSDTKTCSVVISRPIGPPTIVFTVCPSTGRPNVPVHFEVQVTDGVSPYQVRWQPMGENPITNSSLSFEKTYNGPMSTYLQATAIDSRGAESSTVQCNVSIDTDPPTVSCSLSPNPAETNQNVTATASGNDDDTDWSQVQVRWQKESGAPWTPWTTAKSAVFTYAISGLKTVTVEAKDRWNSVSTSTCTVQVNEPPSTTGTVKARSNITASFTITGPVTLTGTTPKDFADKPPGSYTISWIIVAGYVKPANETKTLTAGGTIEFYGYYEYPNVDFTTQTLGPYTLQQPVTDRVEAEGGPAGATYSFYWSGQPSGLSLASNGVITGTPIQLGTFNTTITVTVNGWSGFDKTEVFPITIQDIVPVIELWPTTVDLRTDLGTPTNPGRFHVALVQGHAPVRCTLRSDNERITTYPESEMYTDGYVNVYVNRDGQPDGQYSATITVTPAGGSAQTLPVLWQVGCSGYPELLQPTDSEVVSLSSLTFSWSCIGPELGCRAVYLFVDEYPNAPTQAWDANPACGATSYWYSPDDELELEPYRTYYWTLMLYTNSGWWQSRYERFETRP